MVQRVVFVARVRNELIHLVLFRFLGIGIGIYP